MTRSYKSWLGTLLFLWVGLSVRTTAQTLLQPAEISGPYDCSASGLTKQKLLFLTGNRWVKGPLFDPAAFKVRWVFFKTRSYRGRMLVLERDPRLDGEFRVQKDRVILFSLQPGITHSGLQGYFDQYASDALMAVQEFRIDPASGDLIELRIGDMSELEIRGAFRPLLTCSRDGFF